MTTEKEIKDYYEKMMKASYEVSRWQYIKMKVKIWWNQKIIRNKDWMVR